MEYKISRLRDHCDACGRPLANGETCYSVVDLDGEEPQRRDLCRSCFQIEKHPSKVYWRTTRRVPEEPRRVVDFDRLRDIFVRMVSCTGSRHQELAYLMGLLLVRRRYLKIKDFATDAGRDILVLTKPRSQESYRVEAPLLTREELPALRDKLAALVDGEIDWEGDPATAAGGAERPTAGEEQETAAGP
ncbi:MAG: hypothetical protein AB1486_09585 [Planctomycetota bacterium]